MRASIERPHRRLYLFLLTPDGDSGERQQERGVLPLSLRRRGAEKANLRERELAHVLYSVACSDESVDGGCPRAPTPFSATFSIAFTAGASAV